MFQNVSKCFRNVSNFSDDRRRKECLFIKPACRQASGRIYELHFFHNFMSIHIYAYTYVYQKVSCKLKKRKRQ